MTRLMSATAITLSMTGMALAEAHSGMFPQVNVEDGQAYLASDLMGTRIYAVEQEYDIGSVLTAGAAAEWDDIGEIGDVVISAEGQLQAIIIDVGGFLGIGEREVAVSWDAIRPVTEDDDPSEVFLTVAATEETLDTAPEFTRTSAMMVEGDAMVADAEVEPTPGVVESVEAAEEAEVAVEAMDAETVVVEDAEMAEADTEVVVETVEIEPAEGEMEAEVEAEAAEAMAEVEGAVEATGDAMEAAGEEVMAETEEAMEEAEMAVEGAAAEVEAETEEAMAEVEAAGEEMAEGAEEMAAEVEVEAETAMAETEEAMEETTTEMVEVETVDADAEMAEADTEVVVVDGGMDGERAMLRTPMFEREGFVTATMDELTTEDMTGMRLYDPTDEDIGEINSLIMSADGTSIEAAILDIGGFLGLGEHQVRVTMDELQILRGEDGGYRAYIDATEEELEAQPEYEG